MKFTHAFAITATCVPSRSVLYSGLMPARNGAHPNHSKVRPDLKTLPPYLVNTPETRLAMAQYYTEITNDMEETLQTTLGALQKTKLAEKAVFIYTSDQGPQFPFAKWNLYNAGIRTPFSVCLPGVVPKNTTSNALISHVDLTPTLIELAGGQVPDGLDGHSYLPVLLGQKTTHRETI